MAFVVGWNKFVLDSPESSNLPRSLCGAFVEQCACCLAHIFVVVRAELDDDLGCMGGPLEQ